MLTNTFCHIPGIGDTTERRLWRAGVHTWGAFGEAAELPLSRSAATRITGHLEESAEHLSNENPHYFVERLATREHWRLFPPFRHRTAYLDIETTGLGAPDDYITTIALYDGRSIRTFVHGRNMGDFADALAEYPLIITYNGKSFDVPFIRRHLRLPVRQAHIDLMHVLRSLGYTGGLKGCERRLGLSRGKLEGVDGFFAVLLWHDYRENDNPAALETLLAYNVQDVVNLETLMVMAYNMKLKSTPFFRALSMPPPKRPRLPFRPDMRTVRRIRRERHWL